MIIEYYRTVVYGNETLYIKDEETRQTVRRITGRITIKQSDIKAFEKLGVSFKEVLKV